MKPFSDIEKFSRLRKALQGAGNLAARNSFAYDKLILCSQLFSSVTVRNAPKKKVSVLSKMAPNRSFIRKLLVSCVRHHGIFP